jgi:hypothetical protein
MAANPFPDEAVAAGGIIPKATGRVRRGGFDL